MDSEELIEEMYEEEALAVAIGLTRSRLEGVRQKKGAPWARPSKLWAYVPGGRVGYTKKGVEALLEACGVDLVKKGGDVWGRKTLKELLDMARLGEPRVGTEGCYRAFTVSQASQPRLVWAGILDHKELPYGFRVRVLVKNNAHFVHGMEMMVRPVDEAQYLYEHVGALPRSKGRW